MRIGIVWFCDYPWDVRIEKQSRALYASGHEVYVICKNLSALLSYEERDGCTIIRHACGRGIPNRILSEHLPFNPLWSFWLARDIRHFHLDCLLVRDIPLFLPARRAAGKRLPVLLDMAENYPAGLRIWKPGLPAWVYAYAARVEKRAVTAADMIITVVEEQARRLARQYALAPDRLAVVENTPELQYAAVQSGLPSSRRAENEFLMLFTGVLGRDRGLDTVLHALSRLMETGKPIRLALVGDGAMRMELERLARNLGLLERVSFIGRVGHEEVYRWIALADLCLVPHTDCEFIATTMPNKIYDYMMLGKPVLCSDSPPLARLVRETGAGLTFVSGSDTDLAEKIRLLTDDRETRFQLGANGRRAVQKRYNWSVDGARFVGIVEETARKGPVYHG